MSLPKKPLFDPQSKAASAKSVPRVAKAVKAGTYGRSKANLFIKKDLEEYARANPGPGLIEKVSGGIKALLKKLS
jgi:hypothetical protein